MRRRWSPSWIESQVPARRGFFLEMKMGNRHTSNNGFFDLPACERAHRYEEALERNRDGVTHFCDLPAEERARAYGDRDDTEWSEG